MVPGAHAVTTGVAVDPGAGSNIRGSTIQVVDINKYPTTHLEQQN
jgi:hypothetical protein